MTAKILLFEHPRITSDWHYNDVANAPLSSCLMSGYLAASLNACGHDAEIYDAYLSGHTFEQSIKHIKSRTFNMLGVHAVYFWEHTGALFSMLEKLCAHLQHVPIVLYGIFPTFSYAALLEKYPFIDAIILGEPEAVFCRLADIMSRRGSLNACTVPGTAVKESSGIHASRVRDVIEPLDTLPFPVRTDQFYSRLGGNILGSRGCYNNCSFCCINPFYGPPSRRRERSPENIAAEIDEMLPRLGRKYIYFLDADFFGCGKAGRKRACAVGSAAAERGLAFGLECRSNDVQPQVFEHLVGCGLRDVFIGVESGSAAALRRMKKGVSGTANRRAVEIVRSLGIEPSLGFIMFEPDSTLEDVRENLTFLRSSNLLDTLYNSADVLYHREIVLKGMLRFSLLEEQGRLCGKDPFGHEGYYRFRDPSVQFLADLAHAVCGRILKSMSLSSSPLYWGAGHTPAARRLNEFLVDFFEQTLARLERQEYRLNEESRVSIQHRTIDIIEGLIVEQRVCQS